MRLVEHDRVVVRQYPRVRIGHADREVAEEERVVRDHDVRFRGGLAHLVVEALAEVAALLVVARVLIRADVRPAGEREIQFAHVTGLGFPRPLLQLFEIGIV